MPGGQPIDNTDRERGGPLSDADLWFDPSQEDNPAAGRQRPPWAEAEPQPEPAPRRGPPPRRGQPRHGRPRRGA
jgi:hypothetical protein